MSQRMGMADGRCFTINTSSRLLNDYIMQTNQVAYQDNYTYRQLIQRQGSSLIPSNNEISGCNVCDTPLLKVPNIY